MSLDNPDDDSVPEAVAIDLFAMAALIAMGTWTPNDAPGVYAIDFPTAHRRRAEYAYDQAEAMMKARRERKRPS